jgi:hypothetical protein
VSLLYYSFIFATISSRPLVVHSPPSIGRISQPVDSYPSSSETRNKWTLICTPLVRLHGLLLRRAAIIFLSYIRDSFLSDVYVELGLPGSVGFIEIKISSAGTSDATAGVSVSDRQASHSSPGHRSIAPSYTHTFIRLLGDLLQPRAVLLRSHTWQGEPGASNISYGSFEHIAY